MIVNGNPRYGYHLLSENNMTYLCGFEMPYDVAVEPRRGFPTCEKCQELYVVELQKGFESPDFLSTLHRVMDDLANRDSDSNEAVQE